MTRPRISAYDSAVGYLARRSHSRMELKNKLFRKKYPGREIYQALDRLEELGYLDDRRFAVDYACHRQRQSPRGKKLLSVELMRRGVSRDIIDQVLPEIFEEFPEDRLVGELVEKWRRSRGGVLTQDNISKLARSLVRKGFDWDIIRRQIDTLVPVDPPAED